MTKSDLPKLPSQMTINWQDLWKMTDDELIAFGEAFDARMSAGEITAEEAEAVLEAWNEYKSRRRRPSRH